LDCDTHLVLAFVGYGLANLRRRHFERQPAAADTRTTPMQGNQLATNFSVPHFDLVPNLRKSNILAQRGT
jgi:hypothetical protein